VSPSLVVGLDCSTTAAKAIVWDAAGRAIAEGRATFEVRSPRPGWYEQRADDWWGASAAALRAAVSGVPPAALAALAVTHQRETFVALDEDGAPLRDAIVWMDERARPEVDIFANAFGRERIHRTTGKPASVTPSLYKIAWLRANEPDVFARARFADVHAFLARRLTGVFATGLAAADPMGLVDLAAGDFADDVLAALGLDRARLPALVPTGALLGAVTSEAASATGLRAGLPVFAGGGDGQVAALGAGLADPSRAYLNLGTAVVLGVLSDRYVVDRSFRTMAGAAPGTFVCESDLKGGTLTLEWIRDRFAAHRAPADLDAAAAALPPGADRLVLVPYLASVMNPYWDDAASGVLFGLRGDHGAVHLWRAALEGIAMEQRLAIEGIERATGRPLEALVALGGGARSDLWCRILADVTGRPVVRSRTVEATCLGAGILAAVGAGLHPDLPAAVAAMTATGDAFTPGPAAGVYDRLYRDVYVGLYPTLRDALSRLAAL
jgi:sugar (pentulose or hexulose) kinase